MFTKSLRSFSPFATLERAPAQSRLHQAFTGMLIGVPLLATILAVVLAGLRPDLFGWKDMALLGGFYFASSIGITIGYHRMLTHSSFVPNPVLKVVLLIFGIWALQGGPISWAAIHTKHHVHSDEGEDPHSPTRSMLHAHVGWLFRRDRADPSTYAKAQLNDPITRFIGKTAVWWALLGLLLPLALGGWTGFLWGTLVRLFLVHHVTFSVNSVCHRYGSRPFNTGGELSTNNLLVGILGMGEGWHNNHHAFPRSAFHGLTRRQVDVSGYLIRLFGTLRLAHAIVRVPKPAIAARLRAGGG